MKLSDLKAANELVYRLGTYEIIAVQAGLTAYSANFYLENDSIKRLRQCCRHWMQRLKTKKPLLQMA